ncbi:MAG: hypothetical protein KF833_24270 [Verrucomicrobiae bacterium]|nr:hypothetical protein [Verrucomicrobiae bacterium]
MNSMWRIGLGAAGTGLGVFVVLLIAVAVAVGNQPKVFRSTATLQVETPVSHGGTRVNPGDWAAFDPFRQQSTVEMIQSMRVVEEVVRDLELARRWGLDDGAGGKDVARGKVRRNLEVRPIRKTALMEVAYFDRDPALAAEIANAVVKTYQRLSAARADAPDLASARVIDLAAPGHVPVRPNVPMWFFFGAVASGGVAVLATAGVLVSGYFRRSPVSGAGQSQEDLE